MWIWWLSKWYWWLCKKLGNKHRNEEDEEYIETPPEENDSIKSKISEGITEKDVRKILSANKNSLKVIKVVLFTIDNHGKDILSVGYQNKTIQTQDKWNNLNPMNIQYLLGTNHLLPLSHMAKSYIWLEETKNVLMSFQLDIWLTQQKFTQSNQSGSVYHWQPQKKIY